MLKWESFDELKGLGKNIERLVVCFCAKSNCESTDLVYYSSVLKHCLRADKHTVNLGYTESYGAIEDCLTWYLILVTESLDIFPSEARVTFGSDYANLCAPLRCLLEHAYNTLGVAMHQDGHAIVEDL